MTLPTAGWTMSPLETHDGQFSNLMAAGLATIVFLFAALFYVTCRSFVPAGLPGLYQPGCGVGHLGDVLPSFAHTYAFSVWVAIALGGEWTGTIRLVVAWAMLATALELAQLGIPLNTPLSTGVFDVWDMTAIWAGACAALLTLKVRSAGWG